MNMSFTYWLGYTLFKSAARAFFSYRILNREKLVEEGPVLIVANHQSFLDPPMIGIAYEDAIHYLARKTLFRGLFRRVLPRCCAIPVDQNAPDGHAVKTVIRLLKAGERVLVFPEGSRTPDGEIHDAMPGIAFILSKAPAPVQPLRIAGAYESLPVGARRLRFRPITISVGDPVFFAFEARKLHGRESLRKLADEVMDAIRALPVE